MSVAIRLEDVTVSYDCHPAVHHLSGEFAAGSLTAIAGPNGGGKSTLLRAIVGLMKLDHGRIERSRCTARSRVSWLSQQSRLDPTFPMTVSELAALGLWPQVSSWRALDNKRLERVDQALDAVGLDNFQDRSLSSLSAGQLQRALFARLLLQDADIILLDEPFNALDRQTTLDLLALIQRWHSEKRTIIAVLHDLEQIAREFPNTLILAREGIAWGLTSQVLTPENLRRAGVMAESWQADAPICHRAFA